MNLRSWPVRLGTSLSPSALQHCFSFLSNRCHQNFKGILHQGDNREVVRLLWHVPTRVHLLIEKLLRSACPSQYMRSVPRFNKTRLEASVSSLITFWHGPDSLSLTYVYGNMVMKIICYLSILIMSVIPAASVWSNSDDMDNSRCLPNTGHFSYFVRYPIDITALISFLVKEAASLTPLVVALTTAETRQTSNN